jgi:transposase
MLAGSRYSWLKSPENLGEDQRRILDDLCGRNLKTSRAWAIKETFNEFWASRNEAFAEGVFRRWYSWAIRSRLEPVKRVARMLKKHYYGLETWFGHRISNAVSEGLNSRIQTLKSAARGFRNFANYRTRILFFCGKLDMRPEISH